MTMAGKKILRGAREAVAYARGQRDGFAVHIPEQVDVRSIRRRTGLSQTAFAAKYGFSVAALRNWEQNRRQPEISARAFLLVIDREPKAVERALA